MMYQDARYFILHGSYSEFNLCYITTPFPLSNDFVFMTNYEECDDFFGNEKP